MRSGNYKEHRALSIDKIQKIQDKRSGKLMLYIFIVFINLFFLQRDGRVLILRRNITGHYIDPTTSE